MVSDGSSSLVTFVLASLLLPLERCQILALVGTVICLNGNLSCDTPTARSNVIYGLLRWAP